MIYDLKITHQVNLTYRLEESFRLERLTRIINNVSACFPNNEKLKINSLEDWKGTLIVSTDGVLSAWCKEKLSVFWERENEYLIEFKEDILPF